MGNSALENSGYITNPMHVIGYQLYPDKDTWDEFYNSFEGNKPYKIMEIGNHVLYSHTNEIPGLPNHLQDGIDECFNDACFQIIETYSKIIDDYWQDKYSSQYPFGLRVIEDIYETEFDHTK